MRLDPRTEGDPGHPGGNGGHDDQHRQAPGQRSRHQCPELRTEVREQGGQGSEVRDRIEG